MADRRLTLTEAAARLGMSQGRLSQLAGKERIAVERAVDEHGRNRVFVLESVCVAFKQKREEARAQMAEIA